MSIESLLGQHGAWLGSGDSPDIVVSSRVRLARNLADTPFPGWAEPEVRNRVRDRLFPLLQHIPSLDPAETFAMEDLDKLDKQILFERHLISREHLERVEGGGLVVRADETVAIMVNEEDHLRLQSLRAGLDLRTAWEAVDAVDSALDREVEFAYSPRLGYLTACPSNVGTGMRASVMLHVPGLVLMEEMSPIVKGLGKIGLAVRGLWGEGTEATGSMFQISNQITLGEREADIIQNLDQIVQELVKHEQNARARLMEQKRVLVEDHVGRSLGILTHAHILTSREALENLSGLRLGIDLGIVKGIEWSTICDLLMLTQPGHLQKTEGRKLKPGERDEARAGLMRKRLKAAGTRRKRKASNE